MGDQTASHKQLLLGAFSLGGYVILPELRCILLDSMSRAEQRENSEDTRVDFLPPSIWA